MNYIIEQLNITNYDKSNNVWDMKSCPFTKQFKEQIACGNRESYLMKHNDNYIASCDLVYDYGEYTETNIKVYLSRLIVKKEQRNKGIGQELLKNMIALCKEKGIGKLLWVLIPIIKTHFIYTINMALKYMKTIPMNMEIFIK